MPRTAVFAATALAASALLSSALGQSLTTIGFASPQTGSRIYGLSDDGRSAAGCNIGFGNRALHWTVDGGRDDFGNPIPQYSSVAQGISGDGVYAVGYRYTPEHLGSRAVRFNTITRQYDEMGIRSGWYASRASAASGDGHVVVGQSYSENSYNSQRAFVWTPQSGYRDIGILPGMFFSEANAVSRDGSMIVGSSTGGVSRGYTWTEESGMVPLADVPGDSQNSQARGMSSDGRIIVGYGQNYAAVWRDGVPESLGSFQGYRTLATDCSDDGTVIVGTTQRGSALGDYAIIWTRSTGIILLSTYLRSNGVDIPADFGLTDVRVSADGRTFAGMSTTRISGTFLNTGYVATIPSPSASLLLSLSLAIAPRRRR